MTMQFVWIHDQNKIGSRPLKNDEFIDYLLGTFSYAVRRDGEIVRGIKEIEK